MSMSRRIKAAVLVAALLAIAGIAPASGAPRGRAESTPAAERARYWTAERRAAAIPRDLVIDEQGRGYLRLPDGSYEPYGTPVPRDTVGPVISNPNPVDGGTLTSSSHTFSVTAEDSDGVKSVTFSVRAPNGTTTSYTAARTGGTIYSGTWSADVTGLTDGAGSWSVSARDGVKRKGGNPGSGGPFGFVVSTDSSGGGEDPVDPVEPGATVTNAEYTGGGTIQTAAGRIYFEMRVNRRSYGGYVCSGTVATDSTTGRSVIITAAHCVYDDAYKEFARNVLFIPNQSASGTATDTSCGNDIIGCWAPMAGVVDSDWASRSWPNNIPWDYAYYVVNDTGAHQPGYTASSDVLDEAAGSLGIQFTPPVLGNYTHALGYSYSDDPNFMYCAEGLATESTYKDYWLGSCGLSGGSSGGPWVQPLVDGAGPIISVNSWGYQDQPGMAGPKLAGTSAECLFTLAKTVTANTQGC